MTDSMSATCGNTHVLQLGVLDLTTPPLDPCTKRSSALAAQGQAGLFVSQPLHHQVDQRQIHKRLARFGQALERLATAYEADPEKRRDLVQEIHFAIWRSFAGFDGRCSLRTWL